jgi:hypothetical protein
MSMTTHHDHGEHNHDQSKGANTTATIEQQAGINANKSMATTQWT